MISTMGYRASNSPPYGKTQFELGLASPLQLSSSLFVASRRPSIPLSLTLLHFPAPSSSKPTRTESISCDRAPTLLDQLPVEILCDIFSLCHDATGNQPCGSNIILSHVCRRWRGIVLCMPLLWTHVQLNSLHSSYIDRTAAFLRRAGSCPVSFSMEGVLSSASQEHDQLKELGEILRTHHAQLKAFRLKTCSIPEGLVDIVRDVGFPKLTTLDVQLDSCPRSEAMELVSALQIRSSISCLHWHGSGNFPLDASWPNLTSLSLHGTYTLQLASSILLQCPNIGELSLKSITDEDASFSPINVSLPNLHSLKIHAYASLSPLFDKLFVPNLRNVFIRCRLPSGISRNPGSFGSMLLRSGCNLETMAIRDKTIPSHELIEYLRHPALQDLSSLHIYSPSIPDEVLHAISGSGVVAQMALPRLKSIRLGNCHASDGVLEAFLRSRMAQDSTTPNLLEFGLSGQHIKDEAYLKALQGGGLDVTYYL